MIAMYDIREKLSKDKNVEFYQKITFKIYKLLLRELKL